MEHSMDIFKSGRENARASPKIIIILVNALVTLLVSPTHSYSVQTIWVCFSPFPMRHFPLFHHHRYRRRPLTFLSVLLSSVIFCWTLNHSLSLQTFSDCMTKNVVCVCITLHVDGIQWMCFAYIYFFLIFLHFNIIKFSHSILCRCWSTQLDSTLLYFHLIPFLVAFTVLFSTSMVKAAEGG